MTLSDTFFVSFPQTADKNVDIGGELPLVTVRLWPRWPMIVAYLPHIYYVLSLFIADVDRCNGTHDNYYVM